MNTNKLSEVWNSENEKMDAALGLKTEHILALTRQKVKLQMQRLYGPKIRALIFGLPYSIVLGCIAVFSYLSEAYLVSFGFAAIALFSLVLNGLYLHQLFLIRQVKRSEGILTTQRKIAQLKISSYQCIFAAVFQIPFWTICWMSVDALIDSPLIYGGVHLVLFALASYGAYWIYRSVGAENQTSRIRNFFLSGREWEPIQKAADVLRQTEEYA